MPQYRSIKPKRLHLISVAGEHIPAINYMSILVNLSDRQIKQLFVVVEVLIIPVILGLDFLRKHWLIQDFATCPINMLPQSPEADSYEGIQELQPVVDAVMHAK